MIIALSLQRVPKKSVLGQKILFQAINATVYLLLISQNLQGIANDISEETEETEQKLLPALLTSNAQGFATFKDEKTIILNTNRTKVFLKPGWNTIFVHGPNVFPMTYHVHMQEHHSSPIFFLGLRKWKNKDKPAEKPPLMTITPSNMRSPETMASTCHKLNATIPPTQRPYSSCHFTNLAEELYTLGPFLSTPNKTLPPASRLAMGKYLNLRVGRRHSEEFRKTAENLHRLSTEGIYGFEAVSFHALLNGQCTRVNELASEASQLEIVSPTLETHLAICFEQAGHHNKAVKILQDAAQNMDAKKNEYAPLLYHLARIQMKLSIKQSEPTLEKCAQEFPWFIPCQKRQADIAVAYGDLAKKDAIYAQIDRFIQESITKPTDSLIQDIKNQNLEKVSTSISANPYLKISASLYLLSEFVKNTLKPKPTITFYELHQTRFLDFSSANKVLDLLATDAAQTKLYTAGLHTLARDKALEDIKAMDRLFDAYLSLNMCNKLLYVAIPRFHKRFDSTSFADMLDKRALCFIKSKNVEATMATLKTMHKVAPRYWKTFNRIADFFFLKSEPVNAIEYLRKSIIHGAPDDVMRSLAEKINSIQNADTKTPKL